MIMSEPPSINKTQFFSTNSCTKEKNSKSTSSCKIIDYKDFPNTSQSNVPDNEFAKLHILTSSSETEDNDDEAEEEPDLRVICNNIAEDIGFNLNANGTNFLIEAVLYYFDNDIDRVKMSSIYQHLSQQHNVDIGFVKWSFDNSMTSMRRFCDYEVLKNAFPKADSRPPSAKYIITLFLYELRKNYKPSYTKENLEKLLYCI